MVIFAFLADERIKRPRICSPANGEAAVISGLALAASLRRPAVGNEHALYVIKYVISSAKETASDGQASSTRNQLAARARRASGIFLEALRSIARRGVSLCFALIVGAGLSTIPATFFFLLRRARKEARFASARPVAARILHRQLSSKYQSCALNHHRRPTIALAFVER